MSLYLANEVSCENMNVSGRLSVPGVVFSGGASTRITGNIIASGSVRGTHKTIGEDKNRHNLKQKGSIFYIEYQELHQITAIATSNTNVGFTITVSSEIAGLEADDQVEIMDFSLADGVGGITHSDIVDVHTLTVDAETAVGETEISIPTQGAATSTESITSDVSGLLLITRYKYIDMANPSILWKNSTSLPENVTPTHTNEVFYE